MDKARQRPGSRVAGSCGPRPWLQRPSRLPGPRRRRRPRRCRLHCMERVLPGGLRMHRVLQGNNGPPKENAITQLNQCKQQVVHLMAWVSSAESNYWNAVRLACRLHQLMLNAQPVARCAPDARPAHVAGRTRQLATARIHNGHIGTHLRLRPPGHLLEDAPPQWLQRRRRPPRCSGGMCWPSCCRSPARPSRRCSA